MAALRRRSEGLGPAGLIIAAFALVAAFVVLWFPAREQSAARAALQLKADNQAALIAYTIAPAIDFGDLDMVDEVFRGAAHDTDFVGVVVEGPDGTSIRARGRITELEGRVVAEAPVDAAGQRVGTLRLLMSEDRIAAQSREQLLVASAIAATILLLGALVAGWVVYSIRRVAALMAENARAVATVERAEIRSRFLALMSHEIRTPLNGVLGLADVLAQTPLDERSASLAASIVRSGRNLLALINDVLDVARLESGRLEIEQAPFDPEQSAIDVIETQLTSARTKGLELVLDVDRDVPAQIEGDRHRFQQVLTNLVGNALKFTERGSIVLTLRFRAPDQLDVLVRDTGVGIPADKLESIFEAFSQADASTTRRFGGTGLGLTISRDIVRLMGGTLSVESAVDRGSTFSFSISVRTVAPAPAIDAVATETSALLSCTNDELASVLLRHLSDRGLSCARVDDAELEGSLGGEERALVLRSATEGPPSPALAGAMRRAATSGRARIVMLASVLEARELEGVPVALLGKPFSRRAFSRALTGASVEHARASGRPDVVHIEPGGRLLVAEDDPTSRLVMSLFLEQLGVRAEIVENGRLALARVESGAPLDLILLDREMPELDGEETVRGIRAWERRTGTARVPVIGASAHRTGEESRRALEAGMDGYLTKPLTLDTFVAALLAHAPHLVRQGPPPALGGPASLAGSAPESALNLADVFERSVEEALGLLQLAAEKKDWKACSAHAHRLKGSCLVASAPDAAEAASEVETLAKVGDPAGLLEALVALELQLADAVHAMRTASARAEDPSRAADLRGERASAPGQERGAPSNAR